ncbi:NMT1, partial [Apiospora saccharicola]
YFKDKGIKVTLLEPNDPSAKARGFPVQSIGSLLDEPFTGVIYLKDSGITPDFYTLKGKYIGYLAAQGRPKSDVQILRIDELAKLGCYYFYSILYIGNKAFLEQNLKRVRAFLRAVKKATDFILADPANA